MLSADSVSNTRIRTLGLFASVLLRLCREFEPARNGVEAEANEAILRNARLLIFRFMSYSQNAKNDDDDANDVQENIYKG